MTERIVALQNNMPEGVDGAIIMSGVNRRYFTGFNSSAGTLLITREKAMFIIDFRYIEAAKNTIKGCEIVLQEKLYSQIKEFFTSNGVKNVAIESGYLTIEGYFALKSALSPINVTTDKELNSAILDLRKIKSKAELEIMKQAQALTDESFEHILNVIKPGKSELEIALELEFFVRKKGAGAAFDFIVVSGKRSSMPHGVPSEKIIERGDFVTMDYGASVDGYRSDMTRTVAVGEISEEQERVYNTVLEAQARAISEIKAGVVCKDIDKVARDIINNAGYEGCFGHGLGHCLGLDIHETPAFNTICSDIAQSGMVISVEPGIYIEGKFGCRIEDVVYITDNGCIDITNSEKNIIIL